MMAADGAVAAGREAWARIHRATTFEAWKTVASAVAIGRQHALREANTNAPFGPVYAAKIRLWLDSNGFHGMPPGMRTACCIVADNISAIETWRATLSDDDKARQNNPEVVIRNWRRSIKPLRPSPDRPNVGNTKQHRGYGRAVHWPQDCVKRAAIAMGQSRSCDLFVMARLALESAVRSEDDLIELLRSDTPTCCNHRSLPVRGGHLALAKHDNNA